MNAMWSKGLLPLLLIGCLMTLAVAVPAQDDMSYGPEVKSFLDLCKHEEDELEFQIAHQEISRKDYVRSKNRLSIQRQMVLKRVKDSGEDVVPDLHVVTSAEITQLIEDGAKAVKGVKVGGVIAGKWLYLGSVNRGETYYIFERLQSLNQATRPRTVTRQDH